MTDVLIIGAGMIGCAVARELARAGVSVLVLEAKDDVAREATGAAVGILSYAPSQERPPLWHALASKSLDAHRVLASELRQEVEHPPIWHWMDQLNVATSNTAEKCLRAAAKHDQTEGYNTQWLSKASLREREPGLGSKVQGGCLIPNQCWIDPVHLCQTLAEAAKSFGASFLFGKKVEQLVCDNNTVVGVTMADGERRAKHVLIAAGAWSPALDLDHTIDVIPIRGQALCLSVNGDAPICHILLGRGVYLVPKDGGVIVGASHEHVGFQRGLTAGAVAKLTDGATRLVPALRDCDWTKTKIWSGIRPGTPRYTPFIGPDPKRQGLWWATGHHGSGIIMAPLTGRLLTEAIAHQRRSDLLSLP